MSDSPLDLSIVTGNYPHTRPLKDGSVRSERVTLHFTEVEPANRAFRPMVTKVTYDVSELALLTLILAQDFQRPVVGVPLVLMQQSPLRMIMTRADSDIRGPADLLGRRIGIRLYSQTTGMWARLILQHQLGLDLRQAQWVTFEPAHVDGFHDPPNSSRAPEGKTLLGMLVDGEIDAAFGVEPDAHPDIRQVVPDFAAIETDFEARTGVKPINHLMVVKQELDERYPWLRQELFDLFSRARAMAGGGPPYGLAENRVPMNAAARFAYEQGIASRVFTPDELFPPLT